MTTPDIVVAVDPGVNGAYAIADLRPNRPKEFLAYPFKTPVALVAKFLFGDIGRNEGQDVCFVIEEVHASPIMKPQSAFTFGDNFGQWRMTASAVCSPDRIHFVPPQRWQSQIPGIRGSEGDDRKRRLKQHAISLFPQLKPTLKTCDALLILDWAVRNEIWNSR